MYICEGHFLADFILILKDGKPVGNLMAVDTDLLVAKRLVGFDPETGEPISDLIKVDQVMFAESMPNNLKNLIPIGFEFFKTPTALKQNGENE